MNGNKSLQIKEDNMRVQYRTKEEINALLEKCPVYPQRIVICAINTGMRKGEILNLTYNNITS